MEEVEQNHSEAAKRVEEERMNCTRDNSFRFKKPNEVQSFAYQVLTNACVLLRGTGAYAFAKLH